MLLSYSTHRCLGFSWISLGDISVIISVQETNHALSFQIFDFSMLHKENETFFLCFPCFLPRTNLRRSFPLVVARTRWGLPGRRLSSGILCRETITTKTSRLVPRRQYHVLWKWLITADNEYFKPWGRPSLWGLF